MRHVLPDLAARVAPKHTALVVIDMQNDFCAPGGYIDKLGLDVARCQQVAAPLGDLVEAARRADVPVIWVQAIYDEVYLAAPMLAKRKEMGARFGCCETGSWGAEFFGVKPLPREFVVQKHRYSAFSGTELDSLLRDHGIKTIVVTGVQTNVCVESTLRDGFFNGYYIAVPRDCVASHSPDLHDATLKNVELCFGNVTSGAELQRLWSGAS